MDDFIFNVIPVFIGEGVPLLAPARRTVPLTLHATKTWVDGVVRLHYTKADRTDRASAGRTRTSGSE